MITDQAVGNFTWLRWYGNSLRGPVLACCRVGSDNIVSHAAGVLVDVTLVSVFRYTSLLCAKC